MTTGAQPQRHALVQLAAWRGWRVDRTGRVEIAQGVFLELLCQDECAVAIRLRVKNRPITGSDLATLLPSDPQLIADCMAMSQAGAE